MLKLEEGGVNIERPLELVLVAVMATGVGGLLLAMLGIFKAPQALLAGIAVSVAYAHFSRWSPGATSRTIRVPFWQVLLLVAVAIFFRLPPSNYVSGGQDQGVYVNLAGHIVNSGGISVEDRVAKRLHDSSAAKIYAEENAAVSGDFLLGIFQKDSPSGSKLEFQFYHLFPVFMALVGGSLGLDASVYALTFLSILSVLFFYCLALNLSERPRLAFWAALLLALNPLHSFFSRFPVSEIPTLCMTLAAGWLLARSWRARAVDAMDWRPWWDVLLSACALGCAFLIRMNGFMYLPTVLIIGIVACVYEADMLVRRRVLAWALLVNALYALTVAYGYVYSPTYVDFHLKYAFGRYLGANWGFWVALLWLASLVSMTLLYLAGTQGTASTRVRQLAEVGRRLMGPFAAAALAVGAYKLYVLGWTDRYADDPWLAQRWQIAQAGFGVLTYSSLVVAAQYVSPLLLFVFLGLMWSRRLPGGLSIVLAFVLMFLAYLLLMQWLIPYQPYYARYLVSEFVPYLILFVALGVVYIPSRKLRRVAVAALVLGGTYSAILSVAQLRANEHAGMADSYQRVVAKVGDDDLLLLDTDTLSLPYQLIEMPFMLRYDRYVARASQRSLSEISYLNGLHDRFDQIYLLSGSATPPANFLPVDVIRFRELVAEQGAHPPIKSMVRNQGLTYLYVRPGAVLLPNDWKQVGDMHGTSASSEWRKLFAKGWSLPEPWGMWSEGNSALIKVPAMLADGSRPIRLELKVKPFTTATHPRQRVRAKVDGRTAFEGELTRDATISLPMATAQGAPVAHLVELYMPDAVTPRAAGMDSADSRQLAVGVVAVRLETEAIGP